MLFDPSVLVRRPLEVLAVVLIVVLGKPAAAFLIVLACRYPLGIALIVAGALISITLNSFLVRGTVAVQRRLDSPPAPQLTHL
jgi:CPA2 family monovalent cation:H+ antiporter-2